MTLNLGIRYDYLGWPYSRDGTLGSFDLNNGLYLWDGTNPVTGQGPNARPGIVDPRYSNWAPRVGFAYRIGDKTTIRSGYGIFYSGNYLWEAQGVRGNYPYAISETQTNLNNTATPSTVEKTFSPILVVTPGADVPLTDQHIVARDNKTSYTQQWNLTVQHRLTQDLIAEVGYIGNKGTHLSMYHQPEHGAPRTRSCGPPAAVPGARSHEPDVELGIVTL